MAPHSQYSCLENPMDRGAWWASIHGVALRVGHDWTTSLSLFTFMHWRRKWQPTPVFLPGESQGWRSLVGCCLWGRTGSDTTEATQQQQQTRSRVYRGKKKSCQKAESFPLPVRFGYRFCMMELITLMITSPEPYLICQLFSKRLKFLSIFQRRKVNVGWKKMK